MKSDIFSQRHLGPRPSEMDTMLEKIGASSLEELVEKTIPQSIYNQQRLNLPEGISEQAYLEKMRGVAGKNKMFRSYIGLGFYNTNLPAVIQRNILENPNWYTSYTPYQAEISQGRLEALLNFQTMVMELTGMAIANASLLDESTAVAEAMIMLFNARSRAAVKAGRNRFFVDENIFPQTRSVLMTRAEPLGIELSFGSYAEIAFDDTMFGCFVQYPAADGNIRDYSQFTLAAHENEVAVAVAADLMSLVLITPPGEWGADVVVGSTQRFGIPMFNGGPHAAYFATTENFKRHLPGRIIGISIDVNEKPALRMALQTREQHIKRERATSNICTAQALLASMSGMYGVYHGPDGLSRIASNIHTGAAYLASQLRELGYTVMNDNFFDTLRIQLPGGVNRESIRELAVEKQINFYYPSEDSVQFSTDETTCEERLNEVLEIFSVTMKKAIHFQENIGEMTAFDPVICKEDHPLCNRKYSADTVQKQT